MIQYALDADPAVPVVVDFGDVDSRWWSRQARGAVVPGREFLPHRGGAAAPRRGGHRPAGRALHRVQRAGRPAAWTCRRDGRAVVTSERRGRRATSSPRCACRDAGGALPEPAASTDRDVTAAAEFCRVAVPAVRRRHPAARFLVVGRDCRPPPAGSPASTAWRCTSGVAGHAPVSAPGDARGGAPRRGRWPARRASSRRCAPGCPSCTTAPASTGSAPAPGVTSSSRTPPAASAGVACRSSSATPRCGRSSAARPPRSSGPATRGTSSTAPLARGGRDRRSRRRARAPEPALRGPRADLA